MLLEARRSAQERKVELPPDDCGNGRQIAAALAQRFQMSADDLANSLGDGELGRWVGDEPFRKRAHDLDHRERVALADEPNLHREPGRHRLVALRPRQHSDERERLFLRERPKPQLDEMLVAGEIFESPAQDRRAGQVLLAGRAHHEEWPRLKPTSEERQEAEAHLIAPVEILEDQHHRLAQDEMPNELSHALEELTIVHRTLTGRVSRNAQLGKEARDLRSPHGLEAVDNVFVCIDPAGTQRVDPRRERQDLLGLVAAPDEHTAPAGYGLGGELR